MVVPKNLRELFYGMVQRRSYTVAARTDSVVPLQIKFSYPHVQKLWKRGYGGGTFLEKFLPRITTIFFLHQFLDFTLAQHRDAVGGEESGGDAVALGHAAVEATVMDQALSAGGAFFL